MVIYSGWFSLALAVDFSQFSRADYDLLMRWVNFIILVVLIVKYARRPLLNFIKDKKNEVASLLDEHESRKKEALDKIRESEIHLAASQERLDLIKERILAEGQRIRDQLIADAQVESRLLLDSARLKVKAQAREAFKSIRAELIDEAAEKASAKLPSLMTNQDHDRLVTQWLSAVSQR
jgi:F-type H+-transporting ATPase subunit b